MADQVSSIWCINPNHKPQPRGEVSVCGVCGKPVLDELGWSDAKINAYESVGGPFSYYFDCFDYWTDSQRIFKSEEYTNDDEYGNNCAAPADIGPCKICADRDQDKD